MLADFKIIGNKLTRLNRLLNIILQPLKTLSKSEGGCAYVELPSLLFCIYVIFHLLLCYSAVTPTFYLFLFIRSRVLRRTYPASSIQHYPSSVARYFGGEWWIALDSFSGWMRLKGWKRCRTQRRLTPRYDIIIHEESLSKETTTVTAASFVCVQMKYFKFYFTRGTNVKEFQ